MDRAPRPNVLLRIIRWTARIAGSLISLLVIVFIIGYTFGDPDLGGPPPVSAFVLFGFWIAGVVIAWKREGVGGSLILANSLASTLIASDLIWPPSLLTIFPATGVLFCVCWLLSRKTT